MKEILGWLVLIAGVVVVLGWAVFLIGSHHGYEGPGMGTATYVAGLSLVALIVGGAWGLGSLFGNRR